MEVFKTNYHPGLV